MARPFFNTSISHGVEGWDGALNDNFEVLTLGPWPAFEQAAGDETNLPVTFPPASYDRCIAFVNHTTLGWIMYYSTGTTWLVVPHRAAAQADSVAVTLAALVVDFNSLLAKLRAAGVIAP